MGEIKGNNTVITMTDFTDEQAKVFNRMNGVCKRVKKMTIPSVKKGMTKATVEQWFEWLLYQGTLAGSDKEFKLYMCINYAWNVVKWEQREGNIIKIKPYK